MRLKTINSLTILFALNAGILIAQSEPNIYSDSMRSEDYKNIGSMNNPTIHANGPLRKKEFKGLRKSIGDDIGAAIKAGADKIVSNAKDSAEALLDSVIGTPMLTNCFMSPTNCAVLKDARRHGTMVTSIMENKMHEMEKYIAGGANVLKEAFANCVANLLDLGNSKIDSFAKCDKDKQSGKSIFDYATGTLKEKHSGILEGSMKWANIPNSASAKKIKNLLKAFVGDPILKRDENTVFYENNYGFNVDKNLQPKRTKSKRPMQAAEYLRKVQDYYRETLCSPIIDEGNRFLMNTTAVENLSSELNAGFAEGLFHADIIRSFVDLPPGTRRGECYQLANNYGRVRFLREVNQVKALGEQSLKNPNLSKSSREMLAKRIESFATAASQQITVYNQQDQILGKNISAMRTRSQIDKSHRAEVSYRRQAGSRTEQEMTKKLGTCSMQTGEGCI